ncbi:protein argonaute-2-like [Amblyomma americanum]
MPAFAGRKNTYTRCEIKIRERTLTVDFEEDQRMQKFIVKIQYAATANLDARHAVFDNRVSRVPQEILQAMAIVLRHGPSMKLMPVGRSFFKPPPPNDDNNTLGGVREFWCGFYRSVRPALWTPMGNVYMSSTEPLRLPSEHEPALHPDRQRDSPTLPPMEVCEIVAGQHCKKKLDENQTSEMIKRVALPPANRFNEIRQSVRDLVSSSDQCLREFGIKINTEPTMLKVRVLHPLSLVFENNSVGKPRDGRWELRGRNFYKLAKLTRWILLKLSRFSQRDSLDNFVKMLIRVGQELGMRIEQPLDMTTANANHGGLRRHIAPGGDESPQGHDENMLKALYRATKHKLEHIIYWDGVSAIRPACQELSPNETYELALTFIVFQKHHDTSLMPASNQNRVGKCRNVPPGTIVDSLVTYPLDFDLYLCSHFGIEGTSKPSHYYVVWYHSSVSADMEKLRYYICHSYARCTRSVSIPAPVYYTHLAASRAKNHVMSKVDVPSSSSDSSMGSADSVPSRQYVEAIKVLDSLQAAMYFV